MAGRPLFHVKWTYREKGKDNNSINTINCVLYRKYILFKVKSENVFEL